ncbi:MAG: hypothetical protein S4CHLAM2_01920 [Chlamydiales bacterium]|nr:hypothetical protein [Chlamydiales bacterium]
MNSLFKTQNAILLFLLATSFFRLEGKDKPPPLLAVGAGYVEAGRHHSGGIYQAEYRFSRFLFEDVRPQALLISPEWHSIFAGLGLGLELHTLKHLVLTPSLTPGLYWRGRGKDLGCFLEFRSALELAYECSNCTRLGAQIYHISNASIGRHNPGMNALVLFIAIPLTTR